jgi:hypothetical protein
MSKHTPGPWQASGPFTNSSRRWYAVDGGRNMDTSICETAAGPIEDWEMCDRIEANAHLIALTPELVEVLRDLVDELADLGGVKGQAEMRACALLAKVEG